MDRHEESAVGRPARQAFRGGAALVLGGLTAIEVLALVVAFVSVVGLLWATDLVAPETLLTESWLRAGWVVAVVGVLRPFTWIPWVLAFVTLRRGVRSLAPGARPLAMNALSNVGTAALVAGAAVLVLAAVDGAARWTASALGFVAGTVRFEDLGTATGHWDALRVLAMALVMILIRPVVPPFNLELDLAARPLLGFVEGGRGRFDRWLFGLAVVLGVVAGIAAALG
jgi:hypothetical protein